MNGRAMVIAATLAALVPNGLAAAQERSAPSDHAGERLASGRAIFRSVCARCHGDDGSDTTLYPNIKSLVDVTQRMTASEIVAQSQALAGVHLEGEDAVALVSYLGTLRSGGWAEPRLLVETSWVALHDRDSEVRVVDMRDRAAYAAGHIPGAVQIDEGPLRSPEDRLTYLPKPESFARMMGRAGIANGSHVVVYDDQGGKMAARLWYVLNAYGHERVSLVNGGWNRWLAEKHPISTEVPRIAPVTFVPRATPDLTCPSTELLARRPGMVVLDARSPAEYAGTQTSPGVAKSGRIPGAVNVEWKENVTGPDLVFKSAPELKKLYESKGITPGKEIITHCASGGRAAQTLFTLKLLGYPKVRVYYGSFSDYSTRPDAPVEK